MVRFPGRGLALFIAASVLVGACGGAAESASTGPSGADGASSGAYPAPATGDVSLQGAGATFPAPLYGVWFETYGEQHANVKIDYQANGSGAGIKAITQGTVDFGASDAPMKDEEIAALPAGTTVLHIPTALGAVVVTYNLPGVDELSLDGDAVAGIFLGTITTWNDPMIAALNPNATLPATPIMVVHRSDGSGTTNAFTTYLSAVSTEWADKVGAGKEVSWPAGTGAKGNDGVAAGVKQNEGGIGYVELNYAAGAGLASAKLENAAGKFVAGSVEGVQAAAEAAAADFPADFRQKPIINGAGDATYPIASYTYLLVYQDQADADKAKSLVSFIAWALTDGQALEKDLGYAALPAAIQEKALASLHTITSGGAAVWP